MQQRWIVKSKYYQFKNAKPKVKLKVNELLLKSMYVIKEMIFSNDASLENYLCQIETDINK